MIQRIQSIFLLLSAATFGALFKLPFATGEASATGYLADGSFDAFDHPVLLIATILGALLSVIALFLFRQRKNQIKATYGIMVIAIALPVAAFLILGQQTAAGSVNATLHQQVGLFLPGAAILFSLIAGYFIRKDEKLVQSMDRLR